VFYFKKTPKIFEWLFPRILWRRTKEAKSVYLTFDDGPDPGSTPFILELLEEFDARASFFCLGEQVEKHPELLDEIRERGHGVGTHGFQHLSGWTSSTKSYVDNVYKTKQRITSPLFRPPYGRLTWKQYKMIRSHYQVVMWSRMPGDFEAKKGKAAMEKEAQKKVKPGEIIVLHDRPDCLENTLHYLQQLMVNNPEVDFKAIR
jgi:peptidoglycan/xylan/chitin deacetylase (PgdA/CDA1 family)